MRRVGTIGDVVQGLYIVRSADETYAAIGDTIIDEELEPLGRVVDVFGPVASPYIAVTPTGESPSPARIGDPVYTRAPEQVPRHSNQEVGGER